VLLRLSSYHTNKTPELACITFATISTYSNIFSSRRSAVAMLSVIIAGEAIFLLPFVLPRIFRPTVLAVFDITNVQLGSFFAVYGLVAICAYLFGGPIADKFPANKLMATALVLTGLGGLSLIADPSIADLKLLYGFWGLSTILLFWAAMMRTTRLLGGQMQGFAFGLLDGGRGLTAALIGSLGVYVMSRFLPTEVSNASPAELEDALRKVIMIFAGFVFVASALVLYTLRSVEQITASDTDKITWARVQEVAKLPAVWLQALIILCAYSGYRVTDGFSLLAQDVLGYDDVDAAWIGSLSLWLRPIAAITAGLLADRLQTSRMILTCFSLMIIAGLVLGFGPIDMYPGAIVGMAIVSTSLAVFAMRGLYFAIMGEGKIPLHVTGTAVGIASIVGYLPDIFMAPLMGYFLDANPGVTGHRYIFLSLVAFATAGFLATLVFRKIHR